MTYRQQKGAFEFGHLFQSSINKKNKNKGIKTLQTLMKWTGKGGLVFYQPDTKAMATNTIILHLNWLDLFERFVGSLISLSIL